MSRTKADTLDLFGALQRAAAEARGLRPGPALGPVPRCLCGSTDTRAGIRFQPLNLTGVDDDLSADINEGQHRCAACTHGIAHGAPRVTRHYTVTSTVRDHFHPECVRF